MSTAFLILVILILLGVFDDDEGNND